MSNPIKWNYNFPGPNYSIKRLNFDIGVAKRDYSPTSSTNWWSGITPPTATGYMVYNALYPDAFPINPKPTARYAADDAELIQMAKNDGYPGPYTISGSLDWYLFVGQTAIVNVSDYPNVVTEGLFWLPDPSSTLSYSRGGQYIFDLSPEEQWNEGTLMNGVAFSATGGTGGSLLFDGVDDYVLTPDFRPFGGGAYSLTSFTTSVWFKATLSVTSSWFPLIASLGNEFSVGNGGAYGRNFFYAATAVGQITSTATYEYDTWTNAVFTYDNATQTGKFYKNGVFVDQFTSLSGLTFTGVKCLGTRYGGDSQKLKGNMGPSIIYRRALTAAEVLQNYDAYKVRYI